MNINLNYYFKNPRNLTIIIYVCIMLFIIYLKPNVMFDENYNLKKLGINKNETYLPYCLFSILLALMVYYIINMYFYK